MANETGTGCPEKDDLPGEFFGWLKKHRHKLVLLGSVTVAFIVGHARGELQAYRRDRGF